MIHLTNAIKKEFKLKDNPIEFLDFIGTKYKIEEVEESIFLMGEEGLKNKTKKINLYVYGQNMGEIKKDILEFAEKWGDISIKVILNGLTPGEKYFPLYSPICFKGFNWLKEFGEKTGYPFGSKDKKQFIKWYNKHKENSAH